MVHPKAGSKFFPFLKLAYDARTAGMNDISSPLPNQLYSAVTNPAALGYVNQMQAMLSYNPLLLDLRSGALSFAHPFLTRGVWAITLVYLSSGVFDELLDQNKNPIEGRIHPYSISGGITWAAVFAHSFSFGVTAKGIYDKLSDRVNDEIGTYAADGFAMDIGCQYRTLSSRLIYGFLVQNLGFVRSSYSENIPPSGLPVSFSTGISYVLRNFPSIRTAFEIDKTADAFLEYKAGVEIDVYKKYMQLRGGYRFSHRDLQHFFDLVKSDAPDNYQKTNAAFLCAGIGIHAPLQSVDIQMDIALTLRTSGIDPGTAFSILIEM